MKRFSIILLLIAIASPCAYSANFSTTQGNNYGYAQSDGSIIWVELLLKKSIPPNGEELRFAVVQNGSANGPITQSSDGDSAHYLDIKYTPNSFTVEEYTNICQSSNPFSCQIALNWQTVRDQTYLVKPGSLVQLMYQDAMSGAIASINKPATSRTINHKKSTDMPPPDVISDGFSDKATAWLKRHPTIQTCADQKVDNFHKQNGANAPISSDIYGDFISQCAKY